MTRDATSQLIKDGYFASFNTPSFMELFNLSGLPQKMASWGEDAYYWSYSDSPRYYLFKREAPRIKDFETFQLFMRYNNFKVDPYSNGDPGQMILSRYDLRDGLNPHFKRREFGGLDTKALKLTEAVSSLNFHAIASPEHV